MRFVDYVLDQKPDYPSGFSEFNVMGQFAYQTAEEFYHFIDIEKEPRPAGKLIQFWSHRAPDQPQDIWMDGKFHKGVIPLNIIKAIFAK